MESDSNLPFPADELFDHAFCMFSKNKQEIIRTFDEADFLIFHAGKSIIYNSRHIFSQEIFKIEGDKFILTCELSNEKCHTTRIFFQCEEDAQGYKEYCDRIFINYTKDKWITIDKDNPDITYNIIYSNHTNENNLTERYFECKAHVLPQETELSQ